MNTEKTQAIEEVKKSLQDMADVVGQMKACNTNFVPLRQPVLVRWHTLLGENLELAMQRLAFLESNGNGELDIKFRLIKRKRRD